MEKRRTKLTKQEIEPGVYIPHEEFAGWIKRLLQLTQAKKKIGDLILAGGETEALSKRKDEYYKEYSKVHRLKDHYLNNHVFPAMANLTFFFEAMSMYPELLDEFDDDVKDLLGIKRHNPRAHNYAFMFMSLVAGMISIERNSEDFRVRLMHKLGDLIWFKVTRLKILDTPKTNARVFEDIGLAIAWLEMLGSRVVDEYDLSKLSPRYGTYKTEGEAEEDMKRIRKQILEDFEEYAKQNSPSRTFSFNTKELLAR